MSCSSPTIQDLQRQGRAVLEVLTQVPSPFAIPVETVALEVDVLLAEATGLTRTQLIVQQQQAVSLRDEQYFQEMIQRRACSEPLAYILGRKEFRELEFRVTPAVLIPRPETELLVERALGLWSSEVPTFEVVDVGVGSGCIVLSLLMELRRRYGDPFLRRGRAIGTDVSLAALEVARCNAERFSLSEHLQLVETSLTQGLHWNREAALRVILSNPPYIPEAEPLPRDVEAFEPSLALRAGEKGLDIIEYLLEQLRPEIFHGAILFMEIGHDQRSQVEYALKNFSFPVFHFHRDYQGIDRFVEVRGKDLQDET